MVIFTCDRCGRELTSDEITYVRVVYDLTLEGEYTEDKTDAVCIPCRDAIHEFVTRGAGE